MKKNQKKCEKICIYKKKALPLRKIFKNNSNLCIMAKQSGLHQIRGKVGEHSYYRQTGVNSGLIRSINQGLSQRVKNGDEYANTRLNNLEFGAACHVASELGQMVLPKFRPMILPFSQSKMAKGVFDLARQNQGQWGRRVVSTTDTEAMAAILTQTSKRSLNEFISLNFIADSESEMSVTVIATPEQASLMSSLGIDGISVKFSTFRLDSGKYSTNTGKILNGAVSSIDTTYITSDVVAGQGITESETISIEDNSPVVSVLNKHFMTVAVLMPYRVIGEAFYTLQEFCSFVCIKTPEYSA